MQIKFILHNLLIQNLFIILVRSYDQKIEPYNWIETSPDRWPPESTPQEEFLVYHSEYSTEPLFGLKKDFFDDLKGNVNNVELSFKYWASSYESFRCRDPNNGHVRRDLTLLNGGDRFHSIEIASLVSLGGGIWTHLKDISKDDWTKFYFISQDVFTLALNNVSVTYWKDSGAMIEVQCNMATGCDNIFDRKLPTSRFVPQQARYVPFQIGKEDKKDEHLLKFKKSESTRGDFCIDFLYVAKEVPLEVKVEAEQTGIFYPTTPISHISNTFLPKKQTVCASSFTSDVDVSESSVDAISFAFEMLIYDIDNHYVVEPTIRSFPNSNSTSKSNDIFIILFVCILYFLY